MSEFPGRNNLCKEIYLLKTRYPDSRYSWRSLFVWYIDVLSTINCSVLCKNLCVPLSLHFATVFNKYRCVNKFASSIFRGVANRQFTVVCVLCAKILYCYTCAIFFTLYTMWYRAISNKNRFLTDSYVLF